jgi:uncharacterized Zn finger protein (UPF0148 family)
MGNKFCINCGSILNEGEKFCSRCGTAINIVENTEITNETIKDNINKEEIEIANSELSVDSNDGITNNESSQNSQESDNQAEDNQVEDSQVENNSQLDNTETSQQSTNAEQSIPNYGQAYAQQPKQNTYYQNQGYTVPQQYFYNKSDNEKPMTMGQFMGTLLLGCIPIAGFVLFIVWAFSSDINVNKKNFCRAYLLVQLILIAVVVVIYIIMFIVIIASLKHGRY